MLQKNSVYIENTSLVMLYLLENLPIIKEMPNTIVDTVTTKMVPMPKSSAIFPKIDKKQIMQAKKMQVKTSLFSKL